MHRSLFQSLSSWPLQTLPWLALALSSTALILTALYFQYAMGLEPCVQCIYQRTAMLAIALAAWLAVINPNHSLLRGIGFTGWLVGAAAGLSSAHHHVWLQTASNPLFASCSPYPDFPSWLPLHEWLPSFFAAGGLCSDNSWSFMGMFMSEWMRIIFAVYLLFALIFLTLHVKQQVTGRRIKAK
ncbi:disulfide bond formation protein DsbB [Aliidiomarina celeris]|uniref:disulfide bond formation protein DsbB n=1 Tax=Aliidiomarina celeris TaxID=2249428 RepID=UPI000DE9517C|nr:disulfide bond formation protein DsbB [Aliidiomarina celeris]